jgi:5'-deoxynucleotidase YfbR-like HD superfamily hydrolase
MNLRDTRRILALRSETEASSYERDFQGSNWFKTPANKRSEEKPMKPDEREWIQTYSGRQFFPLNPNPADIAVEDIAHSLSHLCRFAGHCRVFYSVAEHSVRVSQLAERFAHESVRWYIALWGLLHDASEAYLIDLPRPLKRSEEIGPGYRNAETRLMEAVCRRFDLRPQEPLEVKSADQILLMTERRDLLGQPPSLWQEDKCEHISPLPEKIEPWSSRDARDVFLTRFFAIKQSIRTES